ncbi:MAG: hypothetical protein R2720_03080 [Candidatus Nanopelagicales bacterium]
MTDLLATFGAFPFTRRTALEAGMTAWRWRRAVESGQLQQLRYGVYCASIPAGDRERFCQRTAAALLRRTDHFAVGASALAIHDLPNPYFRRWTRLAVRLGGKKTRAEQQIQRAVAVPLPTPWGPVTDLIDTAEFLAAELPLPQALMVTDAVARRIADTEDRFVLASRRCRTEVRHRLTENLDLPALRLADPAAESPAESFYRGHMLDNGFPEPRCGVPVTGESGDQYFIDLLLDDLSIEIDGFIKYQDGDPRVLIAEKRREDDLRAVGHEFHRPFVEELYADPILEMRRLGAKLDRSHRRRAS